MCDSTAYRGNRCETVQNCDHRSSTAGAPRRRSPTRWVVAAFCIIPQCFRIVLYILAHSSRAAPKPQTCCTSRRSRVPACGQAKQSLLPCQQMHVRHVIHTLRAGPAGRGFQWPFSTSATGSWGCWACVHRCHAEATQCYAASTIHIRKSTNTAVDCDGDCFKHSDFDNQDLSSVCDSSA